jgi:hypothetical protein
MVRIGNATRTKTHKEYTILEKHLNKQGWATIVIGEPAPPPQYVIGYHATICKNCINGEK